METSEKENEKRQDVRNIYEIFRQKVEENSSYPLVIFHGRHVSYQYILTMVDALAESMRSKLGVSKGDNIGIALPLSPQFFISFLATQKIGAVAVPLDPDMTDFEYGNILSVIHLKTLFVLDSFKFNPSEEDRINHVVTIRIQDFLNFESSVRYTATHLGNTHRKLPEGIATWRFADLIYDSTGDSAEIHPERDFSLALVLPSRKGDLQAMYFTHRNVIWSVEAVSNSIVKPKGRLRFGTMLPPFLAGPLQLSVILTIFMGGTVTTVLERRDYYKLFSLCSLFDCDYILVSPYDLSRINDAGLPNMAIKSLRGLLCNSYLLNQDTRKAMENKYGTRILEYYGIPEMLGVTHFQSQEKGKEVLGSPGSTINGVEARILEEKTHEPVQEGTTGELFMKGPGLSTEYSPPLEDPDIYFVDDFLDSGDLAQMSDSLIFIKEERRREAIVSAGILVSAREIERVISQVDGVKEVAVVGIPNGKGEEEILAVVSADIEDSGFSGKILKACRAKLSPHKIPKNVEFRKELPKSMSGRILKRQLIEEHTKIQ